MGRILAEQLYTKKENREAEFLLDGAETRFHNFQQTYLGQEDRLTRMALWSCHGEKTNANLA